MPEEALAAAKAALSEAEQLVEEIRRSRTNQKIMMVIISLLVAVVVALGFLVFRSNHTVNDLRENSAADTAARAVEDLRACRLRNGLRLDINSSFLTYNNALLAISANPTDPKTLAVKAQLDEKAPHLEASDCTGDGLVDGADYPS